MLSLSLQPTPHTWGELPPALGGSSEASIPFISAPEYASQPDLAIWVIKDLLAVSGKLSFYAPAKTGKTYAALQMAKAIADPTQTHFLDFPVQKHGKVLYLQLDTSPGIWKANYVHQLLSYSGDMSDVYIADRSMKDVPLPFSITTTGGEWLKREVERLQPVAVIIDTVRNTHLADENDSTAMTLVVEATMAACAPAAVIWIAHPRKGDGFSAGDMVDDTRGSGAFNASVDVIAKLTKTRFYVKGRTDRQEEDYAKVHRDDAGFWVLDNSKTEKLEHVKAIIEEMEGAPKMEVYDAIASRLEVSKMTARRLVKETGWADKITQQ